MRARISRCWPTRGKNYTDALAAFGDALRQLATGTRSEAGRSHLEQLRLAAGFDGPRQQQPALARNGDAPVRPIGGLSGSASSTLSRSGNLMVQLGTLSDAKNDLQQAASLDCAELLATVTVSNTHAEAASPTAVERPRAATTRMLPGRVWRTCTRSIPIGLWPENKLIVLNSLVALGDALDVGRRSGRKARKLPRRRRHVRGHRLATPDATRQRARRNARSETQEPAEALAWPSNRLFGSRMRRNIPPAYEYRGVAQLGIAKSALLEGDAAGRCVGRPLRLWKRASAAVTSTRRLRRCACWPRGTAACSSNAQAVAHTADRRRSD